MVQSIASSAKQLNFYYGPEHDRVKETYSLNGALQRTTVYLNPSAGAGLFYEEDSGVAGTKMKHYVSAGGATVAVIVCTATPCTSTANSSTQYWHEDHLGSLSVVTNEAGAVVERMAYEPFGKRRNSTGVTDPNGTLTPASTDRGYTEQEHMDEVGLINMNGRVYDPGLGRFMSADPTVPHPNSTQSYNRYSYAQNNPLRMLDPSGFSDVDFGDGVCLSCDSQGSAGGSGFGGGSAGYSTLPGDLACFSCGNFGDPMTMYSGFGQGFIPYAYTNASGTPVYRGSVTITGTFTGLGVATIGPNPPNVFNDYWPGRVLGNIAAPWALFTKDNVNPLTGNIENFNGDKRAEAAISLLTLGIGGEARAEMALAKEATFAAKETISTGMLIERTFMTSKGPVDFAAEAIVKDGHLLLKDSVLYGRTEQALTGMSRDIYRGFETMKEWAKAHGFTSLEISGTRAANSTSATPGSSWSKVWDLTK